jgi:hypothetical protein
MRPEKKVTGKRGQALLSSSSPAAPPAECAVAPITSQRPEPVRSAVELPPRVRAHLGLDAAMSWVICDEYNEFDWPGVDLGATPDGDFTFGYLPDAFVERVRAEMRAARARGALKSVPRSE